jgi:hypothetical protein
MLIKAIRVNNHRVRLIQLANGTFAPEVGDLSFALGYRSHDATRKIRATLTNNREVINATKEMMAVYNNVVERDVKRALYFLTEQGLTKLLARTKNDLPETERARLYDAMRATTPAVVTPAVTAVTKVAPTTTSNRYLTRRDICEKAGQKNMNEIQFSEAVANHAKTKYGNTNTRGIMRGKYPEIAKMIRVRNKDMLVYSPKFAATLTPYLTAYVKGVTKQTTPPITVIDMSNGKSVSGRCVSLD